MRQISHQMRNLKVPMLLISPIMRSRFRGHILAIVCLLMRIFTVIKFTFCCCFLT